MQIGPTRGRGVQIGPMTRRRGVQIGPMTGRGVQIGPRGAKSAHSEVLHVVSSSETVGQQHSFMNLELRLRTLQEAGSSL